MADTDLIERKQNYLYDQIINEGYDAEQFMNYMSNDKIDGANIDSWTMDELCIIVQKFKKTHEKQQQESCENNQEQFDDNYYQQQIKTEEQNTNDQGYNYNLEDKNQEKDDQIQMHLQQQQKIAEQELKQQKEKQELQEMQQKAQQLLIHQQQQQQVTEQANQSSSNYVSSLPPQQIVPFDKDPFGIILNKEKDLFQNNDIWKTEIPNMNSIQANFGNNDLWNVQPTKNTKKNDDNDAFNQFNTVPSQNTQQQVKKNDEIDLFGDFFVASQQKDANIVPIQNNKSVPAQSIPQNNNIDFDLLFDDNPNMKNAQNNQQNSKNIPAVLQNQQKGNLQMQKQMQPNTIKQPNTQNIVNQQPPKELQQTQSKGFMQQVASLAVAAEVSKEVNNAQKNQQQAQGHPPQQGENNPVRKKSINLTKNSNSLFIQEKFCKKSVLTVVGTKPDINVQIKEHQIISGSILKQPYAVYHINTMPLNWNVKRNNSDFLWLRNILLRMYPGISLPPLPEKTIKTMNDKLANRRKVYFQCFLEEILNNQQFKSSKYLTDFLSIPDEKLLKQRQKETEKYVSPKNLNEIETSSGKYFINKNPECLTQAQLIDQYLSQNDINYEKLKILSKQLTIGYNQVSSALFQMGEVFSQLHSNISTFNSKAFEDCQVKELEEVYKIMNNINVRQAFEIQDQQKLFENNFYNFFKFHKDSLNGLKDIIKTRNEINTALTKKTDAGTSTGQGVFNSIFGKNKESVSNPSKILKELEDQAGYYNFQMINCYKSTLQYRCKKYSGHFVDYLNQQKAIFLQIQNSWDDIIKDFKCIENDQELQKKYEIMKK